MFHQFKKEAIAKGWKVIKTSRNVEEINKYIKDGYTTIFMKHERSKEFYKNISYYKNLATGQIEDSNHDPRTGFYLELIKPELYAPLFKTYEYKYQFENEFGAYIIPKDVVIGETVWIEDLIEDIVGASHHSCYRLPYFSAIWDGAKLNILFDTEKHFGYFIG